MAIIVEGGGYIVLLIPKKVKELIDEGREEERAEWVPWLKRRNKAEANNQPFNEPASA